MLSKWTPWDYIKSHPQIISENPFSLHAFLISDSYVERFFLNRLKETFQRLPRKVFLGSEMTPSFVEDELLSRGLFFEEELLIVLNADEIPSKSLSLIEENYSQIEGKVLALFFKKSGKNSLFENLSKKIEVSFIKIEEPLFWQGPEFLNFLALELKVFLPYEVKEYLLRSLDHTSLQFMMALERIKENVEDTSKMTLDDALLIVAPLRFDKFKLVSFFANKDYKKFWGSVHELDSEQARELFNFLTSHLIKVAYPEGLLSKSKTQNRYTKEILLQAKLWKREELFNVIRASSEIELEAKKSKSGFLKERLKRTYLKSLLFS